MAANTVTRTTGSALDQTYLAQKALETLEDEHVLADFATPGELPDHAGSTLHWHIHDNFANATVTNALDGGTPITWGSSGNMDSLNQEEYTVTDISKQIQTYGAFIPARKSDLKNMTKDVMDGLAARMAYLMHNTNDTLLRAALDGSGSGFDPNMGAGTTTTRTSIGDGNNDTTLSATDLLTAEDIALAVGDLRANNARPFSNGLYAVIIHSASETHLITDVSDSRLTFSEINKYVSGASGQEKLTKGDVGAVARGMVFVSNNITTSTVGSETGYNNLVLAKDGLGNVKMSDSAVRVFVNKSNESSMSDPHRMFCTVAGQFKNGAKCLDVNRAEVLYAAD